MTMSTQWDNVRVSSKHEPKIDVRQMLASTVRAALIAAGLSAVVIAAVAIRVYVFVPGLH